MGGSSFFDTMKGKLSRRSSTHSTRSATSTHSISSRTDVAPTELPAPTRAPVSAPAPAPEPAPSYPGNSAPPPSYTEAMATPNPTITVRSPVSSRGRAASPAPSGASHMSLSSLSSPEDPFAFLTSFDTVFLIDDSGSMAGRSWREVKEAIRAITPICTAHDSDGIDVYFLNARNPLDSAHQGGWKGIRRAEQVETLFGSVRPSGGTPTGTRLNQIMKPYLRRFEAAVAARGGDPDNSGIKPVNLIVITDGVPTDDPEAVIVSVAKKLDKIEAPPHQIGIQFFQVGKEAGAAEALKELDDGLGEMAGVRDIVDTVTWSNREDRELTANGILKVVLGAVVRRLDRRRTSVESERPGRGGRGGRLAP